jgi:hypothetical protein
MPVNKVKKYLKNLDKETTQFLRARDIANETERTYKNSKSNAVTPAAQAGAKRVGKELKIDLKKERNAKGQLAGALLQGRRYDEKGKQITKPAVKKTAKTPSKTPTKAPAKKKVVQMPSKISPSKMTPAQKAKYLQNPERYDG